MLHAAIFTICSILIRLVDLHTRVMLKPITSWQRAVGHVPGLQRQILVRGSRFPTLIFMQGPKLYIQMPVLLSIRLIQICEEDVRHSSVGGWSDDYISERREVPVVLNTRRLRGFASPLPPHSLSNDIGVKQAQPTVTHVCRIVVHYYTNQFNILMFYK